MQPQFERENRIDGSFVLMVAGLLFFAYPSEKVFANFSLQPGKAGL